MIGVFAHTSGDGMSHARLLEAIEKLNLTTLTETKL
jgi:hypothetical protein